MSLEGSNTGTESFLQLPPWYDYMTQPRNRADLAARGELAASTGEQRELLTASVVGAHHLLEMRSTFGCK